MTHKHSIKYVNCVFKRDKIDWDEVKSEIEDEEINAITNMKYVSGGLFRNIKRNQPNPVYSNTHTIHFILYDTVCLF